MELTAITLTKVVFPEFWSPTKVSSISSFQKRLLNQSTILLMKASMMADLTGHSPQQKVQKFSPQSCCHKTLTPIHSENTLQACKLVHQLSDQPSVLLRLCLSCPVSNMKSSHLKDGHVTLQSAGLSLRF